MTFTNRDAFQNKMSIYLFFINDKMNHTHCIIFLSDFWCTTRTLKPADQLIKDPEHSGIPILAFLP